MKFTSTKKLNSRGMGWRFYGLILITIITTSCMTVQDATNRAINRAVGNAVEREVSSMMAGYSNVMLYQLAYTQAFHVGGFGIHPGFFEEGEGTTWLVESGDDDEMNSYTAERALLQKNEDGSSWWYLKYQPEGDDESLEYEVKLNSNLEPLEMYMRNVNSGEIDHHIFDSAEEDGEETWQSDKALEENGYQTDYFFMQNHEEYHQGTESVRINNRSYESDVLEYSGSDEENNEQVVFTWWVSEDVPGRLVKYEIMNQEEEGEVTGKLLEINNNYQPKFVVL